VFCFNLATPLKPIVIDKEIEEVIVPAHRGELNILPGHAPLMTTLATGALRYRLKGQSQMEILAISWGYCKAGPEGVNILVETAERPEEIDVKRAQEASRGAKKEMENPELDPKIYEKYSRKLDRGRLREEVARQKAKES